MGNGLEKRGDAGVDFSADRKEGLFAGKGHGLCMEKRALGGGGVCRAERDRAGLGFEGFQGEGALAHEQADQEIGGRGVGARRKASG